MVILVNVRVEPYTKSYRKDDFRLLVAYTHRATLVLKAFLASFQYIKFFKYSVSLYSYYKATFSYIYIYIYIYSSLLVLQGLCARFSAYAHFNICILAKPYIVKVSNFKSQIGNLNFGQTIGR